MKNAPVFAVLVIALLLLWFWFRKMSPAIVETPAEIIKGFPQMVYAVAPMDTIDNAPPKARDRWAWVDYGDCYCTYTGTHNATIIDSLHYVTPGPSGYSWKPNPAITIPDPVSLVLDLSGFQPPPGFPEQPQYPPNKKPPVYEPKVASWHWEYGWNVHNEERRYPTTETGATYIGGKYSRKADHYGSHYLQSKQGSIVNEMLYISGNNVPLGNFIHDPSLDWPLPWEYQEGLKDPDSKINYGWLNPAEQANWGWIK